MSVILISHLGKPRCKCDWLMANGPNHGVEITERTQSTPVRAFERILDAFATSTTNSH